MVKWKKSCGFKRQATPDYIEQVTAEQEEEAGIGAATSGDTLYDQAVAIVTRDGRASTSYVQRRLQIGYNRAARLIEQMEDEGVISAPNHAGKREVLAVNSEQRRQKPRITGWLRRIGPIWAMGCALLMMPVASPARAPPCRYQCCACRYAGAVRSICSIDTGRGNLQGDFFSPCPTASDLFTRKADTVS